MVFQMGLAVGLGPPSCFPSPPLRPPPSLALAPSVAASRTMPAVSVAMKPVDRTKSLKMLMGLSLLFVRRHDVACDWLLIPPPARTSATVTSYRTLGVRRSGDPGPQDLKIGCA